MDYKEFFEKLFTNWYLYSHNGSYLFTRKDGITNNNQVGQLQYEITFSQVEGKKGKIYLLNDFYYTTIDEVISELYKIGIK